MINISYRLLILLVLPFLSLPGRGSDTGARAVLQHFYQSSGGLAWQHFEECDSIGKVTFQQKTGPIRYLENLRTGGNESKLEIPALGVEQADGNDPVEAWHQDASGDLQLSDAASPDQIDDRYITRRAYWQPHFGGATVTTLAPETQGPSTWDRLQFKVPRGKASRSGSTVRPACSIASKAAVRSN